MKKITPLHDRVLLRRVESKEQLKGGIIIPDTAKEKPMEGEVVAVGEGKLDDKGSRIKINGMPLETASGDGSSLAALVPPEIFAKAGNYIVSVETPDGRSTNTLAWMVLPKTGPAPEIRSIHPDTTVAGKGFNVQPNGISAMGMTGANFLPGAKILFNGKELETSYGGLDQLAVIVAPTEFAKPGKIKITVKNPDGKLSPPKDFTVTN